MADSGPKFSGAITVQMVIPAGQQIIYSDFVTVQSTEHSHQISFFQLQPPGLESPEALEAFKANPIVPAYCVARFALPRATAERLRDEMERNLPTTQATESK